MKNKARILIIGPYPPIRGGISEFNYKTYKYLKEISNVFVLSIKKSYPNFLFPGKSQFYQSKHNHENFENFNIYNPIEFRKLFRIIREKEINTIIFLSKSNKPVSIDELQEKVWSYQSDIETHTVETHIYRLRKKILNSFNDNEFIISKKNGYQIK